MTKRGRYFKVNIPYIKPCKWIESSLNQYIDGELNPAKRILVSKHMKKCSQCKAAADKLSLAKTAVRDAQSSIEASAYLMEAVIQKIAVKSQNMRGRRWFFSPEFSWGVATAAILAMLISYLVFIKPDVSACNLITTIQSDHKRQPSAADISSILNYFSKGEGDMLQRVSLTIQNNDCKGGDALILHMTVKINNEIVVYNHGRSTAMKPIESSGVKLKKVGIDGKDFYVGDLSDVKVVCWDIAGQPYAVILRKA
jgi:hypothetical protein